MTAAAPADAALHAAAFDAMNTRVTLQVAAPAAPAADALARARAVVERVEAACTRFVPDSPLMRANAAPEAWHVVPPELYRALVAAERAHRRTGGLFDPRVLRPLVALGYDRSLPFRAGDVVLAAPPATAAAPARTGTWQPAFDPARSAVRLGPLPVDLGGIGKGLAVGWAAQELARAGAVHLVEAGGDCWFSGPGPEGDGWRVAVADPGGGAEPLAVLRADDRGVATSSVRVRAWRAAGQQVHHIVDPRTGTSARGGLQAVTVLADDTALAEVWSKSLLVAGARTAPALAGAHRLAALWVDGDGGVTVTPALRPHVLWQRAR